MSDQNNGTVKDNRTYAASNVVFHALVLIGTYVGVMSGSLGPKGAMYVAIGLPIVNILKQIIKQRFPGVDDTESTDQAGS